MSEAQCCSCVANASVNALWYEANCHLAITGASRGFGRALCLTLIEALTTGKDQPVSVTMLLMGRDLTGLEETKSQIFARRNPTSEVELTVIIAHPTLDMAHATESSLSALLKPLFDLASSTNKGSKQWNVLIHNAATLGCLKNRADERLSITKQDTYYRINLTAPMVLTSLFLCHFAPLGSNHPPVMVVNISSLAAVQPFRHMSDYCVGKAARQMYMQCLTVDRPTVAVFNYSPGPLDTDMYTQLAEDHGDEKAKAQAAENKRTGRLIAPEESARVCVSWIRRFVIGNNSEPEVLICPLHQPGWSHIWRGARLDYYDAIAMEKV